MEGQAVIPPSTRLRAFAWGVVFAGLGVLAVSVRTLLVGGAAGQWFALTALAFLSGIAVLRLPGHPATFSLGEAFSFAALFLYGPAAGAVTAAVESVGCNLRLRRLSTLQFVFNAAAPALAMWVAGSLVFRAWGVPLPGATPSLMTAMLAVSVAAAIFFLLESGLVATAIAFDTAASPLRVWSDLLDLWLDPVVGAYVGFLVAFYHDALGVTFVVLILPIPLLLYYAFHSWTGRVDDRIRHLAEINESYQAMVESFATAIDEKDQVTHGHIRRVQMYCLALAQRVGLQSDAQIKALETAALLHDVGKLGIPERILNKPGRLTADEFEHMKQHVAIGTRILGTISFPYPILPIVRHHHENWDGTGYPDGLSGDAIPLGARILMIVDCFDALTSDRPYRRRLPVEEALEILKARRGTMYDAALVDAFIELLPTLAIADTSDSAPLALAPDGIFAGADASPALALLSEAARLTPGWLWAWWESSTAAKCVVLRHAVGPGADAVLGCSLPLGGGISGWVTAEGREMTHCDGRLDLGARADQLRGLREPLPCMSVPVATREGAGSVTCYRVDDVGGVADGRVREIAASIGQRLSGPRTETVSPLFVAPPQPARAAASLR